MRDNMAFGVLVVVSLQTKMKTHPMWETCGDAVEGNMGEEAERWHGEQMWKEHPAKSQSRQYKLHLTGRCQELAWPKWVCVRPSNVSLVIITQFFSDEWWIIKLEYYKTLSVAKFRLAVGDLMTYSSAFSCWNGEIKVYLSHHVDFTEVQ